jgi:hypothetical protein
MEVHTSCRRDEICFEARTEKEGSRDKWKYTRQHRHLRPVMLCIMEI